MKPSQKRARKLKTQSAENATGEVKEASVTHLNESPSPEPPETNPSPPRLNRGRGKKRRLSNNPSETTEQQRGGVVSQRSSLPHHHHSDCNNATTVSAAATSESTPAAPSWETVVKVVPSMDAVVKVFCVHTDPNFSLPWQMKRQYSSGSSGFIIGGRRVLTNAHSVEHHTQVKLKKRGSDTNPRFVLQWNSFLIVSWGLFAALLTVSDDEFWEGVSPVEFGDLPALQDAVTVVGYPIGGDTISVTSGVVSRIEILSYVHGSTELLGLQIDAAINSGNSGGPAFNDKGKCVGIAFQSLKHEDAENIGFPVIGIEWQKMENPDLRKKMGMESHQKGVRIRRIEPTAPESQVLKPSDIILSFDGVNIANDGTVPFRHGERIGFSYLISQKYTGDSALVKILRNKEILEFNVKLAIHKKLIPAHISGKPPSYFIVAGFVFTTVSVPYLRSEYGKEYEYDAPVKLLEKHLHAMTQSVDEQLVVVSQVLVSDINIGYEEIVNTQVVAFNGKPVKNLKCLAEMVENCEDEYMEFNLDYHQIVVL
ncbi:hypothetical protein HID58_061911 [Brassica napus]|uniref:Serine protease n=1 Tax=Brassica napus TaxID=3708 RepID=A0ABQ7ZZX8_BRANA|nr:hypothetical protein HID58_061911 [Brassica napus]